MARWTLDKLAKNLCAPANVCVQRAYVRELTAERCVEADAARARRGVASEADAASLLWSSWVRREDSVPGLSKGNRTRSAFYVVLKGRQKGDFVQVDGLFA